MCTLQPYNETNCIFSYVKIIKHVNVCLQNFEFLVIDPILFS